MEDVAPTHAAEASPPAVVLFTGEGKARAATFPAEEAEVAERAAALMGLRVLRITTDEHRLVAAAISRGRTFSGGKALVPFTKGQIVTQLNAFPEAFSPERPAEADLPPAPPKKPKGRHLAPAEGGTGPEGKEGASGPEQAAGDPAAPAIGVGMWVLACDSGALGTWFPAKVIAQRGEGLLQLRWGGSEWQGEPAFLRRPEHVAVVPSALAGKLK